MSSSLPSPPGKPLTFAQAFDPKRNAFSFLRMGLALLVIFSHAFLLGGFGDEPLAAVTATRHTFGEVGVALFFALSGFLITRSGLRLPSIGRFLWHRWLRIFPGYWMCLLVCAFVFAPVFAFIEHGVFFRVFRAPWAPPHSYVIHNAALFHLNGFSLGGVMDLRPSSIAHLMGRNPYPYSFNGSLWSLSYEFACYLAVAGLIAAGILQRHRVVVVGIYVGFWGLYAFERLSPVLFAECFPFDCGPLVLVVAYFSAGCLCHLYRDAIPFSTSLFTLSVLLMAGGLLVGAFSVVAPAAMTYAFMWLSFKLPVTRFDARGDFSFGTYIYAFPIQQGLVLLHVHESGLGCYLVCSVIVTLVFAVLSYHWIEAPCLRWKHIDPARAFHLRVARRSPLPVAECRAGGEGLVLPR